MYCCFVAKVAWRRFRRKALRNLTVSIGFVVISLILTVTFLILSMVLYKKPALRRKIVNLARNSNKSDFKMRLFENNSHPYSYVLHPPEACLSKPDLFIVVVVHSAPEKYRERMLIRETWGNPSLYPQRKLIVLFMLGLTSNQKLMTTVAKEFDQYRDIVQEDFVDSYRNLTLKAMMWLKFASTFCSHAKYLLKCDDDIVINTYSLTAHLQQLHRRNLTRTNTIACLVWDGMEVSRDKSNKWYISYDEYANAKYSTYCSGAAYVITGDLLRPMWLVSLKTPHFWVDDFFITGLLPRSLGTKYYDLKSLYILGVEKENNLLDGTAVIGHLPGQLSRRYRIWRKLQQIRKLSI